MMPYTVYLKRSAEKELEDLPAKVHDKIITVLLSLKDDPFPRNAKKLHGREGVRIRMGNYRVLYVVDEKDKKIEIVSVADRKEVYR
jgi:mRNA interferase RelE/StbE